MPSLHTHRLFTPVTGYTAGRIVRTPVIHIVAPFASEIGLRRINLFRRILHIGRMSKIDREIFMSACLTVTSAVAIGIRIFSVHDITSVLGKVCRIPGLVQNRLPQPDRRVVAITTYDIADITIHALRKFGRIIPELPAGRIDDHEQTQFVTGIHESRVLRAVGVTDNLHPCLFQFFGIPPMYAVCDSVSDNRKVLVAVGSDQRFAVRFAIQEETVFSLKLDTPNSDTATISVDHIPLIVEYPHQQVIQGRCRRSPEHRPFHRYLIGRGCRFTGFHSDFIIQISHLCTIRLQQGILHHAGERFLCCVAYLYLQLHLGRLIRHFPESDKQAPSRYLILIIGIGDKHLIMRNQPTIPVNTAEIGKVQHILRLSGRIGRIIAVIGPDGNHVVAVPVQSIRHIDNDRQITAEMLRQQPAVHKNLAFPHYGFEMQEKFFPFQSSIRHKMLPIPDFPLIIDATARFGRQIFNAVRQRNDRPVFIIKLFSLRTVGGPFIKTPSRIHRKHFTPAVVQPEKTSC